MEFISLVLGLLEPFMRNLDHFRLLSSFAQVISQLVVPAIIHEAMLVYFIHHVVVVIFIQHVAMVSFVHDMAMVLFIYHVIMVFWLQKLSFVILALIKLMFETCTTLTEVNRLILLFHVL